MNILPVIHKTREYLDYIEEHVNNVSKAFNEIQEKCYDMKFIYDDLFFSHLKNDVENHDLSKMSEYEFVQYRKSFYPTKFESKYDMTGAWEHHKANNTHHWENWTENMESTWDVDGWQVDCAHMVIDWIAMGYKFGDTAEDYYEKNQEKIKLPQHAIDFIYDIFEKFDRFD